MMRPKSCGWTFPDCFENATTIVVTVNRRNGTVVDDRVFCEHHADTAMYLPRGDDYACRVQLLKEGE